MEENVSPILLVKDAARAVEWYERLGFIKQSEHRFEPGLPAFVTITRGPVRIFLSEHKGDARPDTLIYLTFATWTRSQPSSASRLKRRPGAERSSFAIPTRTESGLAPWANGALNEDLR